jgi:hypothetical protein
LTGKKKILQSLYPQKVLLSMANSSVDKPIMVLKKMVSQIYIVCNMKLKSSSIEKSREELNG